MNKIYVCVGLVFGLLTPLAATESPFESLVVGGDELIDLNKFLLSSVPQAESAKFMADIEEHSSSILFSGSSVRPVFVLETKEGRTSIVMASAVDFSINEGGVVAAGGIALKLAYSVSSVRGRLITPYGSGEFSQDVKPVYGKLIVIYSVSMNGCDYQVLMGGSR